ncbi:MAG: RNA polymerase sigma factor [Sedimentisphaerales bacterium]
MQVIDGQAIDWQAVVKKHGPMVWRTAYRLLGNHADTADCFQETFASALKVSRRQYVRNFSALLARLATARAIDRLRQQPRQPHASVNIANWVPNDEPEPFQQVQTQELVSRLRKAIGQLPPQEAQVFCLRYLNDMSYRRIAKELGIKTNAAGVLLHRARTKLREMLEKAAVIEERQV